jgi:hypothetical protein
VVFYGAVKDIAFEFVLVPEVFQVDASSVDAIPTSLLLTARLHGQIQEANSIKYLSSVAGSQHLSPWVHTHH